MSETPGLEKPEPLVRAEEEVGESREAETQALNEFHARKLRAPHINALFKLCKSNPHIWEQVLARNERRNDFLAIALTVETDSDRKPVHGVPADERIQLLRPMWSALATLPEGRALLEKAIDSAVDDESENIRQELREGQNYVRELIIGGGIHGAIYNAESIHDAPEVPRLTVDAHRHIGGQFRTYGGPVLSMNTFNTAINANLPGMLDNPGTNRFGSEAPVQLSDLSGDLFAHNQMVGLVAALNQYLSADTLVNTEVESVTLNKDKSKGGKFKVAMRDNDSDEVTEVFTDRVVCATGIGTPDYGMHNMDPETAEICSKNREAAEKGSGPCIMTYGDFLKEVGDRTNQFPLKRFEGKKVLIVGGGHSGYTVAEYLAGLGPEYRGSVASLGGPSEIVIAGTKFDSSEALRSAEDARYTQLAALINAKGSQRPRKKDDERQFLISALKGVRVTGLKKAAEGQVTAVCKQKNKDGALEEHSPIDADFVIFTTGFSNGIHEVFSEFCQKAEGGPNTLDADLEYFYGLRDGKTPIGQCFKTERDIKFIGNAAKVPDSPKKKEISKKFHYPQNPLAISNTSSDTIECAQANAAKDRLFEYENDKTLRLEPVEKVEVPDTSIGFIGSKFNREWSRSRDVLDQAVQAEIRFEDIVKMEVFNIMAHFKFPSTFEDFDLTVSIDDSTHDDVKFNIVSDTELPKELESFVDMLSGDVEFSIACYRMLKRSLLKPKTMKVHVPVRGSSRNTIEA